MLTVSDLLELLYQHFALMAGFALAVLLFASVFERERQSSTSIAWILAILLIPYIGVPLYLLFGGRKLRYLQKYKKPMYRHDENSHSLPEDASQSAKLLSSHDLPPLRKGNNLHLITDGQEAYEELLRHIDAAQERIDVMTFIISRDAVGRAVFEKLCEKARQGVKVRLLVDALGSFSARFGMLGKLRKAGGEVDVFMRMIPVERRWSTNLRNHRKLMIFDEKLALTGGMNLGREYMGPEPDKARWVDTFTRIEGPAVGDLIDIFNGDWQFAQGDTLNVEPATAPAEKGLCNAQVVASGPDVHGDPLYDLLVSSIYNARQRIWICTPYFIPDQGIIRALKIALRRDVDVRLITPYHSNHRIADMARNRLLRELERYDAHIYLHPKMIHAKHILIDQDFALTGSANIDMRSLYLNYELSLVSDSSENLVEVEKWMHRLMEESGSTQMAQRHRLKRWLEDFCWLLAPVL